MVVTLLNEQWFDDVNCHLALVIQQILRLCSSLEFVSFIHIHREWNGVADCLVKWAFDRREG